VVRVSSSFLAGWLEGKNPASVLLVLLNSMPPDVKLALRSPLEDILKLLMMKGELYTY